MSITITSVEIYTETSIAIRQRVGGVSNVRLHMIHQRYVEAAEQMMDGCSCFLSLELGNSLLLPCITPFAREIAVTAVLRFH